MNISSTYIESCENTNDIKKGGLVLKGLSRTTRQPVHMILLCDTSGSMEQENKLSSVKRSLNLLLTLLSSDDRISLVTFSDNAKIILSRVTPSPEERQAIHYRVDTLNPDGSTNMSAALLEVRNLVENTDSGRKQGVILLTDGHANIGQTNTEKLVELVKFLQDQFQGLSLTTVAYGVDHNAELLTELAKTGGGAYNVVKNLEDVATVFGDILGGLASVSVQGVQIQLPPGAEPNTSYPYSKDAAGMTTIYVGDIYADSEISILFKNHPSKGPIRVKATDMRTLDMIDTIVEPTAYVAGVSLPLAIRMAELRQRTADIIKKVGVERGSMITSEIQALLTEIQADVDIVNHPLKAMLVEDLERAKTLAQSNRLTQHDTIEMAQHSAFLSMARGMRTHTRQVPSTPLQRSPNANAFLSPFANQVQTQIATAMRTMSQRPEDNPQEENDSQ